MVRCGTWPVPNTMALGGVPTGNMNEHEVANARGNTSWFAERLNSVAIVKKIGTSSAALAVLLVNSPRKITKQTTAAIMAQSGHASSVAPNKRAMNKLVPDVPKTALNANPPPNKNNTPQSVFS